MGVPAQTGSGTGHIRWMDEQMDTVSVEDAEEDTWTLDSQDSSMMMEHSVEVAVEMDIRKEAMEEELADASLEHTELEPGEDLTR